jgi:hypothetical protein
MMNPIKAEKTTLSMAKIPTFNLFTSTYSLDSYCYLLLFIMIYFVLLMNIHLYSL